MCSLHSGDCLTPLPCKVFEEVQHLRCSCNAKKEEEMSGKLHSRRLSSCGRANHDSKNAQRKSMCWATLSWTIQSSQQVLRWGFSIERVGRDFRIRIPSEKDQWVGIWRVGKGHGALRGFDVEEHFTEQQETIIEGVDISNWMSGSPFKDLLIQRTLLIFFLFLSSSNGLLLL